MQKRKLSLLEGDRASPGSEERGPHWPTARPHSAEVKHLALLRMEDASFLLSARLQRAAHRTSRTLPRHKHLYPRPRAGAARRASDQSSRGEHCPECEHGSSRAAPRPTAFFGTCARVLQRLKLPQQDTRAPSGNWSCSARAALKRQKHPRVRAASCPD